MNKLVRFVKRGMPWDSRQTFVLCPLHIESEKGKGNAVLEIADSPRQDCVSCKLRTTKRSK